MDMRGVETCFGEGLHQRGGKSGLAEDKDFVVEATYEAEGKDTGHSHPHRDALAASRLEGRNHRLVIAEEHCLHYQQIVEEGDDSVDQGNEHQDIEGN